MALGQNYNNNNDKKNQERELFGDIKFYHPEAEVDPGMLGYSFWSGKIKISISAVDKSSLNSSTTRYDHENKGVIYLRPFEAHMLACEISNIVNGNYQINAGVQNFSKDAIVSVSNGTEFGINSPCLVLRKIDENGNVQSTYVYQFRTDNYVIRNFDESTKDFEKYFYENLEMIMFQQTLEDFARNMNGAAAYGVAHYGRFDQSRTHTKLDSIAEKLGISYQNQSGGNGGRQRQNSIFDSKEPRKTEFESVDPSQFNLN